VPIKHSIALGPAQETLLIPLFARAVESRRKHPILHDPRASELVESIDWDFSRFNQRQRVVACTLRSAIFDDWIREFLRRHPAGTVVEIGAGLNTRFERLDNGSVHWFDLDLPDVVELRRKFFRDSDRRATLAGSIRDESLLEPARRSPGPCFFVAEAIFVYLPEPEVKVSLAYLARSFPGATIAFDTASRQAIDGGNKDFVRRRMAARFAWACDDPRTIETWNVGLRLVQSIPLIDVRGPLRSRLSLPLRAGFRTLSLLLPKLSRAYQLNLFEARTTCDAP
jgi:O-methyltransferase involved in polyketide biosynthesis